MYVDLQNNPRPDKELNTQTYAEQQYNLSRTGNVHKTLIPLLSSQSCFSSLSPRRKKNAFHLIRFIRLSTISINFFLYASCDGMGIFFHE